MGRVLLVDGNNLLYRYHDTMPDAYGPVCYVGGLHGLVAGVRKFLAMNDDHDAVVYVVDKGVPAFRAEVCPEYKQQRREQKTPEEQLQFDRYKEQVRHTRNIVRHTGCAYAYAKGWEGDDTIAALTLRIMKHEGITIYSSDRDYVELVDGDRVKLFSPIKNIWEEANPFYSLERCLDPKQSDNLDGVPGVGKIGAAAAVQCWQFHAAHADVPKFAHSTGKALEDFLLWCDQHAQFGLTQEQVAEIPDRTDRKAMKDAISAMSKDERAACKAAAKVVLHKDKVRANYECTSLRWAGKLCEPDVRVRVEPPDREAFIEVLKTYRIMSILGDMSSVWPVFQRLDCGRLAPAMEGVSHG